jgi:hypothetical protein
VDGFFSVGFCEPVGHGIGSSLGNYRVCGGLVAAGTEFGKPFLVLPLLLVLVAERSMCVTLGSGVCGWLNTNLVRIVDAVMAPGVGAEAGPSLVANSPALLVVRFARLALRFLDYRLAEQVFHLSPAFCIGRNTARNGVAG